MNPEADYVVIDATDPNNLVYVFISKDDIVAFLDDAHVTGKRIKVRKIGETVVDWTK